MDALLPGIRGMLNYHPLFVHFPIALWLAALVFEALAQIRGKDELHRTARWLLYAGTLAGFAAAGTGLLAEESVPEAGPAHEVMETHERLMQATMSFATGLSIFAFFLRPDTAAWGRRVFLVGLVALAVLLTLGADRGAQLVYQYGVGVDWSKAVPQK
jgi:uncharacterized membrane protein